MAECGYRKHGILDQVRLTPVRSLPSDSLGTLLLFGLAQGRGDAASPLTFVARASTWLLIRRRSFDLSFLDLMVPEARRSFTQEEVSYRYGFRV